MVTPITHCCIFPYLFFLLFFPLLFAKQTPTDLEGQSMKPRNDPSPEVLVLWTKNYGLLSSVGAHLVIRTTVVRLHTVQLVPGVVCT